VLKKQATLKEGQTKQGLSDKTTRASRPTTSGVYRLCGSEY